ncbi:tripartite tricarboxylate transporter substrate binding protein [Tindallia californiensis]|uniref:Tripartite-type tricarboxylate transporter, receptor component TctC n=1 Tax=Tindallia californiensis TaxID=159292 RepID=A0A1H3J4L9_9FIRM|nr:tripartite tricarboxylate transporter substrate binding protein [Tindallia californiensis]SDY34535.1 Tripartite-type tricarboxylate transporter, receptor component TctC [Tindallia californiensis]
MKKNKKWMLLLVFVMITSILAGCGGAEETVEEPAPANGAEEPAEIEGAAAEEDVSIDIIVGFGAGGSNDVAARYMAEALREYGIYADVINMAGGMGSEAAYYVANQPVDSNVFFWSQAMTLIFEPAIGDRGYTIEDFDAVGMLASPTFSIGSRSGAPWETWEELIEYIQENPGEVTLGGQGEGSMMHYYAVNMLPQDELDYTYIAFEGGADVSLNLTGGHVDVGHLSLAAARPLHEEGDLTVLVNTQILVDRDPLMPEIPNITEVSSASAEPHSISLFAPRGTDPELVARISAAMEKAAENETLQENFMNSGLIAHYLNAQDTMNFYMQIHEEVVPDFQAWHETID